MSLYRTWHTDQNLSQPSAEPRPHSELKQQIENFLKTAAAQSNQRHLCSRCGAEMEYIDTTFSLLGTSSAWNIKVPFCGCSTVDAGKNSSVDGVEADEAFLDALSRKPSAA